ncbi:hypothetical protein [Janthinobacterium sp. CG_S6]|uniref:hypothetical protein n=1 Tax=Janthinobacterium sp. CG_S6 TaxID=3071707 RepID=UPI0018DEED98|nr:hypothetical protein [Janthinobacterium sp. CG_S6]
MEFINRRQVPWAGLAFLAILLAWGGSLAAEWMELRADQKEKLERIATLERTLKERQRSALQEQKKADPVAELRLKEQQKILKSLNYPWNRLLATIEQTARNDIAILSFLHDQSSDSAQLSVEALDFPALTRFVEQLNEGEEGKRWYVANYQMQPPNSPAAVKATVLK